MEITVTVVAITIIMIILITQFYLQTKMAIDIEESAARDKSIRVMITPKFYYNN